MSPKSTNSLMKHLRDQGVSIGGSTQKRKLRNIGYYHGYKGFRVLGDSSKRLPITDFGQIVSLHALDTQIKTLLYPHIMTIETALKNYTLESVLNHAKSEDFDEIYKTCLTAYRGYRPGTADYKKSWANRLRLRQTVDGLISREQDKRPFFKHFRDQGRAIPIWAIFEAMTLGEFGNFYACLDRPVKSAIVADLGMPSQYDSEALLLSVIFSLKDLRNAIAHNAIVSDVRFKSGGISGRVGKLLKSETGIDSINFSDITDYVILIVYLLSLFRLPKTDRKRLISDYEAILLKYKRELPLEIYGRLVRTETSNKLDTLKKYVTKS
ncbi:MAG: Abi family protein [Eggerthellaceae bacterium]|nr:Abi family protein [Eggerthellaceae bacterium]